MKKTIFILIFSLTLTLLITPLVYSDSKNETIKEKNLHKKSELSSITLNNLRHIYFFNEKGISEKIMTEDQFLDYTLLFKSFFISHSQVIHSITTYWYNSIQKKQLISLKANK